MTGVWGVSMFRDEGDIAYGSIMHMAEEGLDGIIVADNLSTDDTRAEIERAAADAAPGCQVIVVDDDEPGFWQSTKMSALADRAAGLGAEWIVPFDADELWLASDRVGVFLRELSPNVMGVTADLYNHFPSAIDLPGPNPFATIGWRQPKRGALPKVAFRWREGVSVHQGNHGVTYPPGEGSGGFVAGLEIRHFPYRSEAQFLHKAAIGAAAYAATDLPVTEGAHWRQYGAILQREGPEGLAAVFRRWYWNLAPVEAGLIFDPAPFRRWSPRSKENA